MRVQVEKSSAVQAEAVLDQSTANRSRTREESIPDQQQSFLQPQLSTDSWLCPVKSRRATWLTCLPPERPASPPFPFLQWVKLPQIPHFQKLCQKPIPKIKRVFYFLVSNTAISQRYCLLSCARHCFKCFLSMNTFVPHSSHMSCPCHRVSVHAGPESHVLHLSPDSVHVLAV